MTADCRMPRMLSISSGIKPTSPIHFLPDSEQRNTAKEQQSQKAGGRNMPEPLQVVLYEKT